MSGLDRLVALGLVVADADLASLTTYRFGGPARYLAEPSTPALLQQVVDARTDQPVLVLGRGSNLVIADSGFDGLVIRLTGEFEHIDIEDGTVTAGGAAWLPSVARQSVEAGRSGLEFFVGIPGSVGGAVRQNAGGHGSETRDRLESADLVSFEGGAASTLGPDELEMSYRHSNVRSDQIVTRARFRTGAADVAVGRELIASIVRWRKEHQPPAVYNAGSVFRNPPGDSAGRIIDSLGLKGLSVGGVRVSDKHANFFVAAPDASANDVYRLVRQIRDIVKERAGVELHPEIQFVGDFT
jgi:UDP-N-acetylmuramate dehydrogenase